MGLKQEGESTTENKEENNTRSGIVRSECLKNTILDRVSPEVASSLIASAAKNGDYKEIDKLLGLRFIDREESSRDIE